MNVTSGDALGATGWDRLVLAHEGGSLLQSWAWGSLQARFGWRVERLLFDGGALGCGSVQRQPSLLPGRAVYYVPRGPAVAEPARRQVLAELENQARHGAGLVLRIEPHVPLENGWPSLLRESGFAPGKGVQPQVTRILDLRPPPATLRAGFKPKTRYNLALAERKGVVARSSEDVASFARLTEETARRQRIYLPGLRFYQAALALFKPSDGVRLYLAEHQGRALAGIMVFRFGETAYYLYGGSRHEGRELMPNYVLHWQAISDFRALGCTAYDWWGIPDDPSPQHPWFGLYRFKTGFGGETVRYPGLFERVLRPASWRWEERLRKLKRRLGRPILG